MTDINSLSDNIIGLIIFFGDLHDLDKLLTVSKLFYRLITSSIEKIFVKILNSERENLLTFRPEYHFIPADLELVALNLVDELHLNEHIIRRFRALNSECIKFLFMKIKYSELIPCIQAIKKDKFVLTPADIKEINQMFSMIFSIDPDLRALVRMPWTNMDFVQKYSREIRDLIWKFI